MSSTSNMCLMYIADPMCSWCWGFSPVMEAIREKYQGLVPVETLVGGLRPGNTERFDEQRRDYILEHWRAVHERTGQPFNFECRMGPAFTYDTEPASRAVVAVRSIQPNLAFPVFKAIQHAFYVDNQNVTQESILAEIAIAHGIEKERFLETFQEPLTKKHVWDEFSKCRDLGITGFPSLLGKKGEAYTVFTHGYVPFDTLVPRIDEWMTSIPPDSGS